MKKILIFSLFLISCQKENAEESLMQTKCASEQLLEIEMKEDYKRAVEIDNIERHTKQARLINGIITIPVVVNVLWRTSMENISLAQIQSQIEVLNEDFNLRNADTSKIPDLFKQLRANIGISFALDTVIRKQTTVTSWGTNNYIKRSVYGGIDATSPTTKLNIWVGTLSNNLLGYAQFPGGTAATDGVVVLNRAFGSRLKFSSGYYLTNFDRGRTATHEIGHWMNLRHIWGSGTCGDDLVGDTPQANASNRGCPVFPHLSTCIGTPIEMTMNYMDYTNDACMYMFTNGQKARALAIFSVGGSRYLFAQ
jgi:hypothetical protein